MLAKQTSTNQKNEEREETVKQEPQIKKEEGQEEISYAPDFDAWVKEKPRHKYVSLKKANDPKVIRFKSGKPNEMLLSDFNGKLANPVPVARYMVTTPEESKEEQALDVTSKRLAADIQAYYGKGFTELEITRLDTNPVSYRIVPVVAREQQKRMAA